MGFIGAQASMRDGAYPGAQQAIGMPVDDESLILVVEDDALPRELLHMLLRDAGYRVLAAGDAEGGLALLEREPAIALVLSDLQMPGPLDGREMIGAMRERGHRMPVILTSAGLRPVGPLPAATSFLPKPYSRRQLIQAIKHNLPDGA